MCTDAKVLHLGLYLHTTLKTSKKLLQATMGGLHTKYFLQIFNQMLKSTKHGLQEKVQVSKAPKRVQKG